MGINNLNKFLRSRFEKEIFQKRFLHQYEYKHLAVDISLYLYKYKAIFGESWLNAFVKFVLTLRENNIHCVFIYDGKPPPEKNAKIEERRQRRQKDERRILELEEALRKYETTEEVDEILISICKKRRSPEKVKRLLGKSSTTHIDIRYLENHLSKLKRQAIGITKKDIDTTKELFDILAIPYLEAKGEAEKLCSELCVNGIVQGVISEDTDVLAYGTGKFITKIDTRDGTCVEIDYQKVLKALDFSPSEFLDFCIMLGTDYNKNIYRIGPETSYKLITRHRSLEKIEEEETKLDTSILNYKRIREMYKINEVNVEVSYCSKPDFSKLGNFIFKNGLSTTVDKIKQAFTQENLVFCDN